MSRRNISRRRAARTLAKLHRAIEPLEPRRLLTGVTLIPISGPAVAAEDGSSIAGFYLERFDIDPNNSDALNTLAYTLTGAGAHPADPAEVSLAADSLTIDTTLQTLSFNGGTSSYVHLSAIQDDLYEPDEELLLTLYDPNDLQTPLASATAIIKSDDGEIWIDGGGTMNENGGQLTFNIHREDLNGAIAFPSTVTIRLKSAGHGDVRASLDDYAVDSISGAIAEDPETQLFDFTFESWMSTRTLYVNAIDDQLAEGDEWLKIVLVSTDQPNLVLSHTLPTQAFGAIIDDDTPITPPAYLTWLTPAENNNPVEAGSYSFTLHRALEVADYDQLIQIDTTGLDPATLATAYGSGQITLNDTGFTFNLPASQNFFTVQFWLPGNDSPDPTRPFSFTINPQASTYTTTAPGDLEHPDSLASSIIDDDPAPQPTNLSAAPFSDTQIALNWQDNSPNETGFIIEKSIDGVNWSTVQVFDPDTTTATLDNLDPAIDYAFRLRAENPSASFPSDFTPPLPASTQWQNIGAPLAVPITTTGEAPIWLNNGDSLVAGEGYRLVYSSGGVNYSSQSPPNTWTAASYAVRSEDWNYTHWQNEPNGFPFVPTLADVPSIAGDLTWSFTSPGAKMGLYFNAGDPQYYSGPGVTWQLQKQIPHVSLNLNNGNHTTEGDTTPLQITLTRDAYFNEPLTVNYTITPGTADADDINIPQSGTVTIPADSFSVDFPILATDDFTPEWTEELQFTLTAGAGYYVYEPQSSASVDIVDDDLDIVIQGLPEETEPSPHELDPGAFVAINDDDDDQDGTPDNQQSQVDPDDDELEPVELHVPADAKDGATLALSIDSISAYSYRVWSENGTQLLGVFGGVGTPVLSAPIQPNGNSSILVYLEALAEGNSTLTLATADTGDNPSSSSDACNASAGPADTADGDLDLTMIEHNQPVGTIAQNVEAREGGFLPINNDDDDYTATATTYGEDVNQSGAIAGEDDLLPIIIRAIQTPDAQVKLAFAGLKIYRNGSNRTDPITSQQGFAAPAQDLTLYVEGTITGPHTIELFINGKKADEVKVTVFQWVGPLNVPQYGTYEYKVLSPPRPESQWLSPSGGFLLPHGPNPSDVDIFWLTGPNVGKAIYQVNNAYTWDLEVNVVEVRVEDPPQAVGPAFDPGTVADGGTWNPHRKHPNNTNARDIDLKLVTSNNAKPGLRWRAKTTLNGPEANGKTDRGLKQITVGFLQDLTATKYRGIYAIQGLPTQIDKSEQEGLTYWDNIDGSSGKWYSSDVTALLKGPKKTDVITSHDSPGSGPPLTCRNRNLTRMELVWDFHLFVAATSSSRGAQGIYATQAQANWKMNGTGNIGPGRAWQPGTNDSPGITAPEAWGAAVDLPKTDEPQFNSILYHANFVVVQ